MKVAVYGATRNVYEDVIPSIKSLLLHSDVDKIYILAEDNELPFYLPKECEVINVSRQEFFRRGCVNYFSHWSYMILLRTVYAEMFPDLDRILSLDNDTIIKDDISDLWDIDLDDYYFAAVKEPGKSTENFLYTCIGVAMFNLDFLRKDEKYKEIMLEVMNIRYSFPEQDVFNNLCQGHILELSPEYGMSPWTTQCEEPKIEHFAASSKQWRNYEIVKHYRDIPLEKIRKERL